MKLAWKRSSWFLVGQLLCVIPGLVVIFMTDQKELHLWFNRHHSPLADIFFRNATHMAEGLAIGFVVFLALVDKVRHGVIAFSGIILSSLITQFLKRVVFFDHYRPSKVFAGIGDLHFVQDVILHQSFSFPSGHATAAFSLFLILAWLGRNRWIQLVCLALALTVAYSRVYLSQHFFEDILTGSLIGSTVTFLIGATLLHRSWGDRGIFSYFGTR